MKWEDDTMALVQPARGEYGALINVTGMEKIRGVWYVPHTLDIFRTTLLTFCVVRPPPLDIQRLSTSSMIVMDGLQSSLQICTSSFAAASWEVVTAEN